MRRWGATELASFPPRASQMLMSLRAIAFIFIMPHYDFYEYMALRTYICKNNTKKKGNVDLSRAVNAAGQKSKKKHNKQMRVKCQNHCLPGSGKVENGKSKWKLRKKDDDA